MVTLSGTYRNNIHLDDNSSVWPSDDMNIALEGIYYDAWWYFSIICTWNVLFFNMTATRVVSSINAQKWELLSVPVPIHDVLRRLGSFAWNIKWIKNFVQNFPSIVPNWNFIMAYIRIFFYKPAKVRLFSCPGYQYTIFYDCTLFMIYPTVYLKCPKISLSLEAIEIFHFYKLRHLL